MIGMNGLGVKLTNILSSEFKVVCITDEKKFSQVWKNNMKVREREIITSVKNNNSTTVSFTPDLFYFHNPENECNITSLKDIEDIIYTRLLTVSVTHPKSIKIVFNDKVIKCRGLKSYMRLFTGDRIFHEEIPGVCFEYGVALSTTGSFEHQSFVNCQRTTSDKSSQTRYITLKICNVIADYLKKKENLSTAYITNHLHVFVNMHMLNPDFNTQTKVELTSNISAKTYPIDSAKILSVLKKTGLLVRLEEVLCKKVSTKIRNTLNSSGKHSSVNIPKLDDAHDAGTAQSAGTMLFLVEGDSAKTMVSTGMSVIGRKKYGVFPLKGKVLNVKGASAKKIAENKEICNIIEILGLKVDKTYTTLAEIKSLRYSRVCILADADLDGYHITGLLVNFIHHFWPNLLQVGFLKRFVTPIIKISKGSQVRFFFTIEEYNAFEKGCDWHVKHLKGLGTSRKEETLGYFKNMETLHLKNFNLNTDSGQMIKNIFDPKETIWRKNWLSAPLDESRLNYSIREMNISTFLKTEMYDYSSYNIKRAIPSAIDGLKVSQRKIICACLKKFNSPNSPSFKVAQLASFTAAYTNYAHGEVSLQNTIINMAQSFSGSNNIPFLFEDGAFGTRRLNGNDSASARYIFTKLNGIATALITETSPNVLKYLVDENMTVEPEFYVPTMPIVLVNGSNGIATGFRTLVPSFNPDDIIHNIHCKFDKEKQPKQLVPWYGGTYKTNDLTVMTDGQWVFQGIIETISENILVITELPMGLSIDDYKEKVLVNMVTSGKITKFVVDHVSENEPKFVIHGFSGNKDCLIDEFKLTSTMTTTCMNLLIRDGQMRNFKDPVEIFEYWFEIRKEYCKKSHENTCVKMQEAIVENDHKMRFISGVVDGTIELRNTCKKVLLQQMFDMGIPIEMHDRLIHTPVMSITKERYAALKQETVTMTTELQKFKCKSVENMIMEDMTVLSKEFQSRKRDRDFISEEASHKRKKV